MTTPSAKTIQIYLPTSEVEREYDRLLWSWWWERRQRRISHPSRMLADWRAQCLSLEEQLQSSARNPSASPDREAGRVAAELADLRRSFTLADPRALRAALATVIEEITLYWTDGGPRKWRFQRGTIRLGGSLRLLSSFPRTRFSRTETSIRDAAACKAGHAAAFSLSAMGREWQRILATFRSRHTIAPAQTIGLIAHL